MALLYNLLFLVLTISGVLSGTGLTYMLSHNIRLDRHQADPLISLLWFMIYGSLVLVLFLMAQKVWINTLIPQLNDLVLTLYICTMVIFMANLGLLVFKDLLDVDWSWWYTLG